MTVSAALSSQSGQTPTNSVNEAAASTANPVDSGTASGSVFSALGSSHVFTMIRR